jgi:hypothetical protein
MLHCVRVSFPPLSGSERIVIEAPVRPDMQRIWQAFAGVSSELQA